VFSYEKAGKKEGRKKMVLHLVSSRLLPASLRGPPTRVKSYFTSEVEVEASISLHFASVLIFGFDLTSLSHSIHIKKVIHTE
jgi:hypothetical protein